MNTFQNRSLECSLPFLMLSSLFFDLNKTHLGKYDNSWRSYCFLLVGFLSTFSTSSIFHRFNWNSCYLKISNPMRVKWNVGHLLGVEIQGQLHWFPSQFYHLKKCIYSFFSCAFKIAILKNFKVWFLFQISTSAFLFLNQSTSARAVVKLSRS